MGRRRGEEREGRRGEERGRRGEERGRRGEERGGEEIGEEEERGYMMMNTSCGSRDDEHIMWVT